MADIRLGPFLIGIDHVSPEVSMPEGTFKDAINIDLDREGNMNLRAGLAKLHDATHAGTIWKSRAGASYIQIGDTIYQANYGSALTLTAVATLNSPDRVSFTDLMASVCYSNRTTIGLITGSTSRALGVEDVEGYSAAPNAAGGLPAGNYAVGVSFVNGEEQGALSPLTFVTVPEGGGILLTLPTPNENATTGINIYITGANAEALRFRARAPLGMGQYLIGVGHEGPVCEVQNKWRTLPGAIVRAWHGRLLVARGRTVYFTDAMRYGVIDPRHGFVQEARPITLMEPVDGGVFVGTSGGVVFYRGTRPKEWVRVPTDGKPPVAGTGRTVAAIEFGGDVGAGGTFVALWLSGNGFVIGGNDGVLKQPQATRIRLDAEHGALLVHDRRIVAVVL